MLPGIHNECTCFLQAEITLTKGDIMLRITAIQGVDTGPGLEVAAALSLADDLSWSAWVSVFKAFS
jgi:hypothetical protein